MTEQQKPTYDTLIQKPSDGDITPFDIEFNDFKEKIPQPDSDNLFGNRNKIKQILGDPNFASTIDKDSFKVHKVKPGNAKGVLGFKNTTVGNETYTQLIFKPFVKIGDKNIAQIDDNELTNQPLLNLNGDEDLRIKERKMTSNLIANIADSAYDKGEPNLKADNIEDANIQSVTKKDAFYNKPALLGITNGKGGQDVDSAPSMKEIKLVGGKSKRRRIQRRKSVRRRRMSNRKR